MNIKEVFSNELYDSQKFYDYFSKDEIQKLPYDLYNLIDLEKKMKTNLFFRIS